MGYLKQVINADAPTSVYWKAEGMDAEMHLTRQTTGNLITTVNTFDPLTGRLKGTQAGASGSSSYAVQNVSYDYDTLGNLKTLSDSGAGASAVYTYDDLNRLKTETRLGTAVTSAQVITWGYNDIGNVISRSDVSNNFNYPASGASSVRPHAISNVVGTVNGVANPSYTYDANGNLLTATGRTVSWTSFNKIDSINRTTGSTANKLAYLYDAEGERVKETYTQNGNLQRTTIYLNPGAGAGLFYEEDITPAGTKKKHYINAGGSTIGVLTLNTANTSWTTQYWHKDHLGSTVVVTDGVGAVTERMSYEPFGKRRKVDGMTDLLATLVVSTTRRGFTGHEMMDEVGLVNMNGRLYDPAIGRFLSPDPDVPHPGDMQSYGRYSYVRNNPTSATDPTGYFDESYSGTNCFGTICFPIFATNTGGGSIGIGAGYNGSKASNPISFNNPSPPSISANTYNYGYGSGSTEFTYRTVAANTGYNKADNAKFDWGLGAFVEGVKSINDRANSAYAGSSLSLLMGGIDNHVFGGAGARAERAMNDGDTLRWGAQLSGGLILGYVTFSNPAGSLAAKGTPLLRQGYVDAVSELGAAGNSLRAAGAGSEDIARVLHAERRAIGEQFKALTPIDKLTEIYERNTIKYGDKLGPSVDWLRSQGKSWDQIIESAGRTGGKDLGF